MRSRTLASSLVCLVALAACSARGNFGNTSTGSDSGSGSDTVVNPGDGGSGTDVVIPPFDIPPGVDAQLPDIQIVDDRPNPEDRGNPPRCGDGMCNGTDTCMNCPSDCGDCPASCGDHTCNSGETCHTCPMDCGACPPSCGDGTCNGSETCSSCSTDCGTCPPRCGDGTCNGTETCSSCVADCGACPDPCTGYGSCGTCTADFRCGWCAAAGSCYQGSASGPTDPTDCTAGEGWTRTCTPADSGVVDAGPTNITAACVGSSSGLDVECGWIRYSTISCTPGGSVSIGCTGVATVTTTCFTTLGSCAGDPMMRVCAGSGQCSSATRLVPTAGNADDACATSGATSARCPLGRFTCPSSGTMTAYWRPFASPDGTPAASCSLSHSP